MIGVVLITHGRIGQSMLEVATRLVEIQKDYIQVVSSCSYDQPELLVRVENAFKSMPDCDGFLVLTDLFGATPTNVTQSFMRAYNLAVITGLNMPMLLKALTYHKQALSLDELAGRVYDASKACIVLEEGDK
ncbi:MULTISPECIES: PTS sugar transporter subunit IIA [Cysteiniphilum]|uniref:PTS sugar transporter subunit IIA n=1 Tax=Cysteiniphilum litorale TaxID=2056700 RepID=A0A8J2Z4R0_9GAMM|nr:MULTISPECIES: PTS sugar transporter subunit IIA [Cysteiniphilum]WHN66277.1 PTS sugar transporter subunit IIA [Cysteiniphilum sp. QT6929]GGG00030.1 PTS sugar transporter subunit IIA [Cysteiniphilum litorale]